MNKRIIGLAAVLLLAIQAASFPVLAKEAPADNKSVKFAVALGFMSQEQEPESKVTRAELAKVIAKFSGYEEPQVENPLKYTQRVGIIAQYDYKRIEGIPIFKDVPKQHWAVGFIEHAALQGYMRGTPQDKFVFNPEGDATKNDMYGAMLKALGYPSDDVLSSARTAGITVSGDSNTLTFSAVAGILYKTCLAKVQTLQSVNPGLGYAEYNTSKRYMEYAFHLYLYTNGRVTANDRTDLETGKSLGKGKAKIDSVLYADPSREAYRYLGYACDVFYVQNEQDENDKTIKLLIPKLDSEDELLIAQTEIEALTRPELRYSEGNRTRTAKLSPVMDVVYNNQLLEEWTPESLLVEDAFYTFTDTDKDGVFDLLNVKAYEYMVVQSVQSSSKKIAGKFSYPQGAIGLSEISIDDTDGGVRQEVMFIMNGQEVGMENASAGAQLCILRGKGTYKRVVEIEIVQAGENLVADGLSQMYGGITYNGQLMPDAVWSGEMFYRITKAFYAAGSSLVLGEAGTAYLTKNGSVFAIDKGASTSFSYGFMKTLVPKKGLSEGYQMKVLDAGGQWNIFEVSGRLNANDRYEKAGAALERAGLATFTGGKLTGVIPQLIRYKAAGTTLVSLQTATLDLTAVADPVEREAKMRQAVLSNEFRLGHSGNMMSWGGQRNLDWTVILTASFPAFVVPKTDAQTAEDRSFSVRNNTFFEYNIPYYVKSYDENVFGQPKAVVVETDGGSSVSPARYYFVVDKSSEILTEDGETAVRISGYYRGSQMSYTVSSDILQEKGAASAGDFEKGNILKIAISSTGEIENYTLVYNPRVQGEFLRVSSYSGSNNNIFGRVLDADGANRLFHLKGSPEQDGANMHRNFWVSVTNAMVVVYDGKSNTVVLGTMLDIEPGDYCVVRMEDIKPSAFVVYRNAF